MAFSLYHTQVIDNSNPDALSQSSYAAVDYLFDTFLPSRGWTYIADSVDGSSNRKIQFKQPMTNWNNNDADYDMNGWISYRTNGQGSNDSITFYEDGMLDGNDYSNSVSWTIKTSSYAWGNAAWKFWTSDEDDSLFLITQGGHLHFYGAKLSVGVVYPNTAQNTSAGQRSWNTHILPFCSNMTMCNLPLASNTSSNEYPLQAVIPSSYEEPVNYSAYKNFMLEYSGTEIAKCDYSDWRLAIPAYTNRQTYRTTYTPQSSNQEIFKVQSGSEWYIATSNEADDGFLWYMGQTEPELV